MATKRMPWEDDEIVGGGTATMAATAPWEADEIIANPGNTKPEVSQAPRIPLGASPVEALARGFLPRSIKAEEEGAGVLRKAGAGAMDALSAPGRVLGSLQTPDAKSRMMPMGLGGAMIPVQPDAVKGRTEQDNGMAEAMADIQGQGLGQKVLRDPALIPSMAFGGPLGRLAGKGLSALGTTLGIGAKAAPVLAKAAPTAGRIVGDVVSKAGTAGLRAGATGAVEGTLSAAIHQGDRAAQGEDVDLHDAATEIALSALIPAVVSGTATAVKEGGKEVAKGIMQTALKPNKSLMQGRGTKLDIQKIFDFNLDSPKGLEAMDNNIKAFRDNVKANYGDLLAKNAGKKFNIRGALSQAIREAEDELGNFKNADQVEGIKKGIEYWKDYLKNTSLDVNNGWMPIEDVASLRAGVWGAAKFNQASPAGYAEFAEKFGHKINDQLGNILPEARALDAQLAATKPMAKAAEDALQRIGNNRYISLMDVAGLGIGGAGAALSGDKEGPLPGLGIALAARGLRSPAFASTLYRGAAKMPALGASGPLQVGARRLIGSRFRE